MWCADCGYEYVDGVSVCPDCGEPLTDTPPDAKEKKKKAPEPAPVWPCDAAKNPEKPALLSHIHGEMDKLLAVSKLAAFGIPVQVLTPEVAGSELFKVISGISVGGYDLYVPESLAELAKTVLFAKPDKDATEPVPEGDTPLALVSAEADAVFARFLTSSLEERGIPAYLRQPQSGEPGPGLFRVLVPGHRHQEAALIFAELTSGEEPDVG